MSDTTREINKVTGTIIRVSWKLIVYAVVALLLYEGITRGYAFGHDIFSSSAMASEPGVDMRVTIKDDEEVADIGAALEKAGVIKSRYAFVIQSIFYDYGSSDHPVEGGTYLLNNSMTSKEIILALREGIKDEAGEE
ncbi:MAG: endolytic transglycosylase MltG [Hungatella sp.]|jgi:cell division protein YceG involved in septum cleavage|nr:endolytic transglycosylase MltG [Hungatella sp.]